MTDPTNKYRKPAKRAAYEHALRLVAQMTDANTALAGSSASLSAFAETIRFQCKLSKSDARDVAAKAIRVECGRRMRRKVLRVKN